MYYACFYAVIALLLKYDISTQTHQGARAMLGLHFVSKGVLSKENGKTFHDLFEKRTVEITMISFSAIRKWSMNFIREQ